MIRRLQKRQGVTVLECAVVFPLLIILVVGLIIAGVGVFRYQEVAALAREGARWASVRGQSYQFFTGKDPATPEDVYNNVIKPRSVALDQTRLKYSVTWDPDNRQKATVTVRIDYQWIPEALLGGINLSSTARTIVSY
jgi:Flp pilus assembly protein TadG